MGWFYLNSGHTDLVGKRIEKREAPQQLDNKWSIIKAWPQCAWWVQFEFFTSTRRQTTNKTIGFLLNLFNATAIWQTPVIYRVTQHGEWILELFMNGLLLKNFHSSRFSACLTLNLQENLRITQRLTWMLYFIFSNF